MGFRMVRPWEHPRSKVWWFRRRIPARLARFGIVAREIKESLHTKDWDEALIRCALIGKNLSVLVLRLRGSAIRRFATGKQA